MTLDGLHWTNTTAGIGSANRSAYLCHICNKWFLRGNISCAVYHADGHCHYGDTEITMGEAYRTLAPRLPQPDEQEGAE